MKNYPHSKSANNVDSANLIKYLKYFSYTHDKDLSGIYCPLLQPFHRGPLSMVPDQALSYSLSAT